MWGGGGAGWSNEYVLSLLLFYLLFFKHHSSYLIYFGEVGAGQVGQKDIFIYVDCLLNKI